MNKTEKLKVAQYLIDGMNELTIRFASAGVDANGKYIKKVGEYHTKQEIKDMKKIHDSILDGMKTKKDENDKDYTDFDGAVSNKPLITKGKEKTNDKHGEDTDLDDIVAVYFLAENKDKVIK